jgi:hypothetical protein
MGSIEADHLQWISVGKTPEAVGKILSEKPLSSDRREEE